MRRRRTMITMEVVSRSSSTLNPNAPLFIPTAYRQVEDFSPEWWRLVQTSSWFRDFWLSQHPEGSFEGGDDDEDDVVDLLPESFDFGADEEEEFRDLEAEFKQDLVVIGDGGEEVGREERKSVNGLIIDAEALLALINVANAAISFKERSPKSPVGPAKYQMKPPHCSSPKCTPRRIQQPR